MSDDVPMACGDVFGINDMLDRLEVFCREQGIEQPVMRLIEVDGVLRPYFIPLHLVKNDQMCQYDVEVISCWWITLIGRIGRQRRAG